MHRHVFMSLFKSVVFSDIVQIISSNNNGPLHLHLGNDPCQDTPSDANVAGEWTFSVDIVAFLSLVIYKSFMS